MFHVTYARYTAESIEAGDADEHGHTAQDIRSLRDALDACDWSGEHRPEADSAPISVRNPPRWFTCAVDETSERSLHLVNITPSSAMRIARLIGAYGVN